MSPIELLDDPRNASNAQTESYAAFGECIYCGSKNKLTDEHIVPYGLGGTFILPKSSCLACAKITGKIERTCLRTMLGDLRSWRNIRRRRRGKKNKYIPRPMLAQIGNRLAPYAAPSSDERADVAMMFALDAPTILSGKSPIDGQFHRGIWVNGAIGQKAKETAALAFNEPVRRIASQASFNPELFSKMLAKIAHAHAMADEAGQFNPLLPPYIVGDAKHLTGFLVGGEPNPVPNSNTLFEVSLLRVKGITDAKYLMSRIRLFGDLGAPVYYVVVGELL